jgi:hypothetical protein
MEFGSRPEPCVFCTVELESIHKRHRQVCKESAKLACRLTSFSGPLDGQTIEIIAFRALILNGTAIAHRLAPSFFP